jgi:pyruvate/2-oxoglutarate dehydrogenase complex dihydrolipoamide dehydrogenase (E3) component
VTVELGCKKGAPRISGNHLLLAVGRRPNTDDLGLEAAGLKTDRRGYIAVDNELQTSLRGVWAIGDVNGHGGFTHTSYNDYEIVAANLFDGEKRSVHHRITAYALFIDPPLGRVGQTEEEVRASGKKGPGRKARHELRQPCARTRRNPSVYESGGRRDDGRILGAAILGISGDEVVHTPDRVRIPPTLLGDLEPLA